MQGGRQRGESGDAMIAVSDHLCRRVVGVRDVTGGGVPIIGVSVGAVVAAIPGGVEVTALATQKGGVVWAGWARAQWMDARGGAIGAALCTWPPISKSLKRN